MVVLGFFGFKFFFGVSLVLGFSLEIFDAVISKK